MPKFVHKSIILMFDRDKSLKKFNTKFNLNDNVIHVRCCQHIKENITKNNKVLVVHFRFWRMIKTKIVAKFIKHIKLFHREFFKRIIIFAKIDFTLYAVAYILHYQWNYDTNAVNECVNEILKMKRFMNVLNFLTFIWNRVMFVRFKRFCKTQNEMNINIEYILYCVKLMKKLKLHVEELRIKSSIHIKIKIITSDVYEFVYDV